MLARKLIRSVPLLVQSRNNSHATVASSYLETGKYVKFLRKDHKPHFPLKIEVYQSDLFCALQKVWKSVCVTGKLPCYSRVEEKGLVKRNTPQDLIRLSRHKNCGITASVIDVSWLDDSALADLSSPCYVADIGQTIKPVAMMVHTPESAATSSSFLFQNTYGSDCVGRLVVIMGSEFTGGEVVVTHQGRTETVTGAWNWVACRDDCNLTLNAVTSGTRTLLVYDICSSSDSDSDGCGSDNDEHCDTESDSSDYSSSDGEDEVEVSGNYRNAMHDVRTNDDVYEQVRLAVNKELDKRSNIVIALDTLYPECSICPTVPLQGVDLALYYKLCEHFHVEVVASTVQRYNQTCYRTASLYSREIVKRVLSDPNFKGNHNDVPKLVIVNKLRDDHLLDYSWDGSIYMLTCLRVSRF